MKVTMYDTELEELRKALKKRDKFLVDRWLSDKTQGRVSQAPDELYENWAELAQFWTYPDLRGEVNKVASSLK